MPWKHTCSVIKQDEEQYSFFQCKDHGRILNGMEINKDTDNAKKSNNK